MSTKFDEYQELQAKADRLKQAAVDEAVTHLVERIENAFAAAERVKEISPEYEFSKLSKFRKLAVKFGLSESVASEPKASKRKPKGAKSFKLSDEKAKAILDFIGERTKSTKEIAVFLGTENPSNAISALAKQGKIVIAKTEGLKKFWKRA